MEPNTLLSLDEPETSNQEPQLSLNEVRPPLPQAVAERRAAKADVALGEKSPGKETLTTSFANGTEDMIRESAANTAALDWDKQKIALIDNYAREKAKKGGSVTQEEVDFFREMTRKDYAELHFDKDTFFESEYAKKHFEKMAQAREGDKNSVFAQAAQEAPEELKQTADWHRDLLVRKESFQSLKDETDAMSSGVTDWAEQFIPGKSTYNMSNAVPGATSLIPGKNREEQYSYLHSLPPAEAFRLAKQARDEIAESNTLDAQAWIDGLVSYNVDQSAMDTAFGVLDAADVAGIGAGVTIAGIARRGARTAAKEGVEAVAEGVTTQTTKTAASKAPTAVDDAKAVMKEVVREASAPVPEEARIQTVLGRVDVAAVEDGSRRFNDMIKAKDPLGDSLDLRRDVPALLNPKAVVEDVGSFGYERARRVFNELQKSSDLLIKSITEPAMVTRMSEEAVKVALRQTEQELVERVPNINKGLVQFEHNYAENSLANTYTVSAWLGSADAKPFESAQHAIGYAKNVYGLDENQFRTIRKGDGWFIRMDKDVNETTDAVRDALIDANRKSNDSWINTFLGRFRSADDLVSTDQRANRYMAQSPATEMQRYVREAAEPLIELSKDKKARARLGRILENNRDYIKTDPTTGQQVRGQMYENIGQLEEAYLRQFNDLPSEAEVAAYFNYKQLMEHDLMMRNLGIYRDIVRQGGEKINVKLKVRQEVEGQSRLVDEKTSFTGVVQKELPWGNKNDAGIFIQDQNGTNTYLRKNAATAEQRDLINRLVNEQGYKIVQVFNPLEKPLSRFAGTEETVHFAVMRDVTPSRLDWYQLKSRPGVHVVYTDQHFVKQPKVRRANSYFSEEGGQATTRTERRLKNDPGPRPKEPRKPKDSFNLKDAQEELKELRKKAAEHRASYKAKGDNADLKWAINQESQAKNLEWKIKEHKEKGSSAAQQKYEADLKKYNEDLAAWEAKSKNPEYDEVTVTEGPRNSGGGSDARHIYEGDIAALNVATEAEGKLFAERMNTARQMIKNNVAGADEYISQNLPWDAKTFRSFFEPSENKVTGKVEPPKFHIDDAFHYTPSGRNVSDEVKDLGAQYANFENDIRNPYNLFGAVDKKFAGQRDPDLPNYRLGEGENAMLQLEKPRLLDPFNTLNGALGNVMRSRFFNDYKIAAVEDWVQEFKDVLKVDGGLDELRRDPVWYLHNPPYDTTATDKNRLAAAQNARQAILNFIGTQSEVGQAFQWLGNKLHNQIFEKGGKGASDFVAEHMLPMTTDPLKYVRSVAFHSKLGLFNPSQLLMQSMGWFHIAALSPTNVLQATSGQALMMRMAMTKNEGVINKFADMATNLGWKKQDFLDSHKLLKETGFMNVEGETAWRNDFFDPKVVQTKLGRFLDAGTIFFKYGEKFTRLTAWNTAFLEWRKLNPGVGINARARNQILSRAQDLTVNMTRASNALWQEGLLSIPTQFLTYQVRLMEQFLGGRLTPAEKLRAFTMYAGVFGVPTALGAATGIPFYESMKQSALENGTDMSDPFLKSFYDGVIMGLLPHLVGADYNYSQRLGPGGLKLMQEIVDGDKGVLDVALGASGSIIGDMMKSTYPALMGLGSVFSSDPSDRFPLVAGDFMNIAQNVSSINSAARLYYGLNTAKYITKNGVVVDDVTTMDSIIGAITGLQTTEISDAMLKMDSMKDQKTHQDEAKKQVIAEYRLALKEAQRGNAEQADAYFKRAKVWFIRGGFQPQEASALFREATRGHTDLVDSIDQNFWKKSNAEQQAARMKQFIKDNGGE